MLHRPEYRTVTFADDAMHPPDDMDSRRETLRQLDSTGLRNRGSGPRTLSGLTFQNEPFDVELSADPAISYGASAGIRRGLASGPWSEPVVVAVKIFGQLLKPSHQELLRRELRTASQAALRHPLILEFIGTVDVGDQRSLVSLYMKNGNLLQFIKSNPDCDKRRLILQVAEAVNYLHTDVGLVHGDLKGDNVLISDAGDALLADFGLSTFVEKSQLEATTMTGIRAMYTARFAAPELLLGTSNPNVRPRSKTRESDVYAFGMLVLEALTERPPWYDHTSTAMLLNVTSGMHPAQPLSNGFVTIRHTWWETCKNCWSLKPEDRPPMDVVLDALQVDLDPRRELVGHTTWVNCVVFLPGGDAIASGSFGGSVRIWDVCAGDTVIGFIAHDGPVLCISVSPDGRQICTGGVDQTIRRWDAQSGAPIGKPMLGHAAPVHSVAFSPDSAHIVSGAHDNTVRLWDAATGEVLWDPLGSHGGWVWCVAFSPDGAFIASGSSDCTIGLWKSSSGALVGTLPHESRVFSLCFSPNLVHLVSGCVDGTVLIWNVQTRQLHRRIEAHSQWIRSVAISPCGGYIASGSDDRNIRIWDAQTGDPVGAPLTWHTYWVRSVAFSPDGRSLVSGSEDRTVRLWDLFQ